MRQLRRVGIIGVGIAGRARARAVREHPQLELVGAYRGRFLTELGIPEFSSSRALLDAVDGIIISSPNHTHSLLIRQALEAKVDVCVEFPAVPPGPGAVAELSAHFELARRQERVLHVEHIELLSPVTTTLREHLRGARLSRIDCHFTRPTPASSSHSLGSVLLPRLHRVSALAGPVTAIRSVEVEGVSLRAAVATENCEQVHIHIEQSPALQRALSLRVWTEHGRELQVVGRRLTVDGVEVALDVSGPLFAIDLDVFVKRVTGGAHYVSEAHLLHILDVSSRLTA